ncbi:MAG: beta-Ala-His dipeptidase, partial [Chitinispirillaceae bacterium]|nr:beta-Ala-His dipeptidase [Chitinispirillaceae bacterium]
RKDAVPGRERAFMVALQCHLDMVCEKNSDSNHDFSRDPITLIRRGNELYAAGTTLGADNGVGVATALAIMEDRSIRHGPLEFLFTVDEETGLNGAQGLKPGFIRSRTLLNLDSEDEGVVYVGCAGGVDTTGKLAIVREPVPPEHRLMTMTLRGLAGGHSGLEIHTGRGNAVKLLARALTLLGEHGVRLTSFSGGNKRNAIPREAAAVVAVPAAREAAVTDAVARIDRLFKAEYRVIDKKIELAVESRKGRTPGVLRRGDQKKMLRLLHALPHGVLAMSGELPGLVETSTNLARVTTSAKTVEIETSQRSAVESKKQDAMTMVRSAFELAGATVKQGSGYPGWRPDLSSPVLKTAREAYLALFNKEVEVRAVHAGLECGIIGEKYPGLDMLSLGPTLRMVHSPQERIVIDSVGKYWRFLVEILERV